MPKGAIWSLFGSLFYSIYIVLLKRKVNNEENMVKLFDFLMKILFFINIIFLGCTYVFWIRRTFQFSLSMARVAFLPFYWSRDLSVTKFETMGVTRCKWSNWYRFVRITLVI